MPRSRTSSPARLNSFWLLLLLFALKLFATSLTLGSGASGGVFSPALFLGATLGSAYGVLLQHIFPGITISPVAFAVVGMAGIVGGTTGAAITAIVMIFEMTLDYGVIVPMTTTVAIAYGVRKMISNESIYTLKLTRRGHRMPSAMQANIQYMKPARELNHAGIFRLPADMTLPELAIILPSYPEDACFVAMDEKKIAGVITINAALQGRPSPAAGDDHCGDRVPELRRDQRGHIRLRDPDQDTARRHGSFPPGAGPARQCAPTVCSAGFRKSRSRNR